LKLGNALKIFAFNTIFYSLFFLFSAIAIPPLTLIGAAVRCFRSRRKTMIFFHRAISWYGKVVVKVLPFPFVRVIYSDDEPGRPLDAYIGVCNHQSASDPFLLSVLKGEFIQVVNVWPFRLPVLGPYARWAEYLSVREMEPDEFMDAMSSLLASGVSVFGFPEGTRSRTGEMGSFHSIMFRVALRNNCPIVPICITGNERAPTPGSGILHPAVIHVRKLAAVEWDSYKDMKSFQLKNFVRERLIEGVAQQRTKAQSPS